MYGCDGGSAIQEGSDRKGSGRLGRSGRYISTPQAQALEALLTRLNKDKCKDNACGQASHSRMQSSVSRIDLS
jgi:hypothetical protein